MIKISPDNWRVDDAVSVKICQVPMHIVRLPLPQTWRVPRFDVWQLNETFYSYDQPLT